MTTITAPRREVIQGPSFLSRLFTSARAAWLWLPLRLWLGYQWLDAGSHKVGNPAWTETGVALKGFWTNAVSMPEGGRPPIAFDWYRSFIQTLLDAEAYTWFAKLIAYGELLIGIALIAGALIGVTAFFAAFMNWNFMMAGSASTNPLLFVIAIGLLLAWRVAGRIGVDYAIFNHKRILNWVNTRRDENAVTG
jgi:thiosulfate dehydrogenase [quinone] large subunit